MIQDNVLNLIGNTPLIKLRKASEKTGCNIYGKAEFLNPGQSVKDRAALNIIKTAIESGQLHPRLLTCHLRFLSLYRCSVQDYDWL